MKIALSSYSGYGRWFQLKLMSEGHRVDYYLSEPKYANIMGGLLPPPIMLDLDHRQQHPKKAGYPDYSKYDLSIFDITGRKKQADYSREWCPTIGDGSVNCFLENDRVGGIKLMEEAGVNVPEYEEFSNIEAAKAFVKKTGKRYVFKPDGGQEQDTATTYVSKSAEDLLEYFDKLSTMSKGVKFILQEFTPGIECSCEGWFNGEDFYCINATIEEKKFMSDNHGPNTGCAGNLVFTLSCNSRLYREGLGKCVQILKDIEYVGMIDLNTILTETDVYGLEWTPRFGYDASATLSAMYAGNFGELLYRTASGGSPEDSWNSEFGVSARLSIPPYPSEVYFPKIKGIPIKGIDPENEKQMLKTYMFDCMLEKNQLVCGGHGGFLCCPIEIDSNIPDAWDTLEDKIKHHFQIPDMQYRSDLKKSTSKRYLEMQRMGWL